LEKSRESLEEAGRGAQKVGRTWPWKKAAGLDMVWVSAWPFSGLDLPHLLWVSECSEKMKVMVKEDCITTASRICSEKPCFSHLNWYNSMTQDG
jgi:hypothetical protein